VIPFRYATQSQKFAAHRRKKSGGMTTVTVQLDERNGLQGVVCATASGTGLALAALVSYELTTRILTSAISSRDDQLLGGMWSVVATLFVCRESYKQSIIAALSRTAATSQSFILCLGYLLLLPFSSWGMAILIAIGAVLLMMNRPGDVITASITTAVVMVVAGISQQHAWRQPILRLFDTLIGIAVGITAVWIGRGLNTLSHFGESRFRTEESQLKITKETLQ
jgi:Fusaric acid resistance protein-like